RVRKRRTSDTRLLARDRDRTHGGVILAARNMDPGANNQPFDYWIATMRPVNLFLAVSLVFAGGARYVAAAPAATDGKPVEATIPRPSWGKVSGWVVDAVTRRPVVGAAVALEIEGAFPAAGRGLGKTDA